MLSGHLNVGNSHSSTMRNDFSAYSFSHYGNKNNPNNFFFIFLTVHLRIIPVGDQLDAQFLLLLTQWSRVLLDKLSSKSVKKFPAFMEPETPS